MPTDLILVRHGLTDWNEQGRLLGRSDVALNERGRDQAAALGEALRNLSPQRLIASPQSRAQQTATVIASACGLEVETDPDIDEVWLGRWRGKRYDELADDADVQRYLRDPTYECDAVESFTTLRRRLADFAARIRCAGEPACAVVSHGDPLRILVAELIELPVSRFRSLLVEPGSATILRLGRKRAQLAVLNWKPGSAPA
jgi:broad specificity phosphatase PhoE